MMLHRMHRMCRLRRCRGWILTCLPFALIISLFFYCQQAAWPFPSLHLHHPPSHTPLSGFRKLLQDSDKGHFHVNTSTLTSTLSQRLPTAIIIGVRKCGTRALLDFLSLHPDIVTAEDEMHFFNDDDRYRLGLEWYRRHMPPSLPHQITMEKTPRYFISPITPLRVHRMNSSVRLLVLLRHPTTRVVSDYTQIFYNKQGKNQTLPDFEDLALDPDSGAVNTRYKAVQISLYHQFFRHWTAVFPRPQIHVVDGDQLITDPVSEIRQIENFLGVRHHIDYSLLYYNNSRAFYCMRPQGGGHRCLGASKGRKHPHIKQSVLQKLDSFFRPHNQRLFDLVNRTFPWS